jgi:O-acetylserine/cysteine efflux transporter
MPTSDRLKALLVAAIWGCNVVAIRIGLDHFPPLFFAALRFAVIALPTVLLVRLPAAPLRWVVGYGLGFGVLQFGLLFVAMDVGMPPGLASLVLQSSAPFTVLLGVVLLREQVTRRQWAGLSLAVLGLAAVTLNRLDTPTGVLPVLLTLMAGLGWAIGSICSRLSRCSQPLRLVLWMSVVATVPLYVLSAIIEGPRAGADALHAAATGQAWPALLALGYIVLLTTLLGSGLWSSLLQRYPASAVAPYSLAVPVAGILGSWAFLSETPSVVDVLAGVVVVVGLLIGASAASGASGVLRRRRPSRRRSFRCSS